MICRRSVRLYFFGALTLLCLIAPAKSQVVGPGGVSAPDLWLESDDAGNIAAAWQDNSTNNNPVEAVGSWSISPADRAHNFHPYTTGYTSSRYFRDPTSFMPASIRRESVSVFSAVRRTSAGQGRIVGVDDNALYADEPGFSMTTDGFPRFYKYSGYIDSQNASTAMTINRSGVPYFISDDLGGTIEVGLDGQSSTRTRVGIQYTVGRSLLVGYGSWTGNTPGAFPGDVMEVIWYRRALSAIERNRVNSYLALKHGATLLADYLDSAGTIIWNFAAASGFNQNVAGIGYDQSSGLHQKQSNSINSGDQVIVSLGASVAASNASNAGAFAVNRSFLIWGDDAGSTSYSNATTIGGTSYNRMARTWRLQQSGTVPQATIAYPYSGSDNVYLIIGDTTNFSGANTVVAMANMQTIEGTSYRTTSTPVSFGANSYFTFATITPDPLIVTSTADTNTIGTLRYAINHANSNPDDDNITFNIADAGPHVISPLTGLPEITDDNVSIDGTSQSGAVCNMLTSGTPHILKIQIDGAGTTDAEGLILGANNVSVSGLSITGFDSRAIRITGTANDASVDCSYIGVEPDGTTKNANARSGSVGSAVAMQGYGGSLRRSVVSGNDDDTGDSGIFIGGSDTTATGNIIGLSADSATVLGNANYGFHIRPEASNVTIGGTNAADRNIVSGNGSHGLNIDSSSALSILGNYIGTDYVGLVDLGNGGDGIRLTGSASGGRIGDGTASGANIIAHNAGDGVHLTADPLQVAILSNAIHSNGGQGIDLAPGGVTDIDAGDVDTGPNDLLNFPLINALISDGTSLVAYDISLDVPGATHGYRIEFFRNSAPDATHGEGEAYLGAVEIAHAGGELNFTGSFTANVPVNVGDVISTTTTRKTGAVTYDISSEFSGNATAALAGDLKVAIDSAVYDPGGSNLKSVPQNDMLITVTVSNDIGLSTTADTIVIIVDVPSDLVFYNGDIDDAGPQTNPVSYDGSNAPGLTFTYGTDVRFSDAAVKPAFADCDYIPPAGYDPAVRFICINPKGTLPAGDPEPSFYMQMRQRIR